MKPLTKEKPSIIQHPTMQRAIGKGENKGEIILYKKNNLFDGLKFWPVHPRI